ncbi:MAG: hypothetical protein V3U30_00695 [Thermoplasmata archaeon]
MAHFETIRSEPVLVRRVVLVPLVTYLILVVVAETAAPPFLRGNRGG